MSSGQGKQEQGSRLGSAIEIYNARGSGGRGGYLVVDGREKQWARTRRGLQTHCFRKSDWESARRGLILEEG